MSLCGEIWRKEYIDYRLDNHILFSQACKAHILKMDFFWLVKLITNVLVKNQDSAPIGFDGKPS